MQLFDKKNQNIIETAKLFIKKTINVEVENNPIISINSNKSNYKHKTNIKFQMKI